MDRWHGLMILSATDKIIKLDSFTEIMDLNTFFTFFE